VDAVQPLNCGQRREHHRRQMFIQSNAYHSELWEAAKVDCGGVILRSRVNYSVVRGCARTVAWSSRNRTVFVGIVSH
jgi:hypothetical protein